MEKLVHEKDDVKTVVLGKSKMIVTWLLGSLLPGSNVMKYQSKSLRGRWLQNPTSSSDAIGEQMS
ncbi:predicted protein [Arabidopsis lyrata subsp. lyrata]|uniref:Predicted protein n=1 Tax=Arabidopsis lyrata subsp. lyrata TaxID=81972 RepID=D7ML63_ARALL|nr:predicted protein [Arabidopsis lyrata subsp. lyrata]